MDADGPNGIPSPGTEEETIARKRSRRVSFADTTAVHVFDRDEDFETPPEERSASHSPSPYPRRSSAGAEDGEDTSDAGSPAAPIFFVPDIESSSPDSAAGSVVSADDDIFFGPVSSSFIQIGRPSDSGMSEDANHHDITLDSRTFSRHFLKTAVQGDCTASSVGSLRTPDMASKGYLEELDVSEPGRKSSSGREAPTDMSILTGSPGTYGYAKLSPKLNDVVQNIPRGQVRNSPIAGIAGVNPDQLLVLTETKEDHRVENSCIGNDISSNELGALNITMECISMRNPISTSRDPIQEDNEKSSFYQQKEEMDTETIQHTPRTGVQHERPEETYRAARSPKKSKKQLMSTSELSVPPKVFKEKQSGDNDCGQAVKDTETIQRTPRIGVQHERPEETSKAARSPKKSKKHLTAASELSVPPKMFKEKQSGDNDGGQEVKDTETIQRTPITGVQHEWPEETSKEARSLKKSEKHLTSASELSVPSKVFKEKQSRDNDGGQAVKDTETIQRTLITGVQHEWLEETSKEARSLKKSKKQLTSAPEVSVPPKVFKEKQSGDNDGGQAVKDTETIQRTPLTGVQHEWPEETSKAAKSLKKSKKKLTSASELSVPRKVFKEKQSGDNDSGQAVKVDWNKVVCIISNATEQVLAPSIIKLNSQQLHTLGDKLDDFQMARRYRRLSTAVRVEDCCGDRQKKLAEARSLHERLLYERAKLQINNAKLAKLRNKSLQCQIGIQECSFLKSKILGAAQMNNVSLHDTSLICSNDGQEPHAVVSKKRLGYNVIQQKVETIRSSLENFCNIKVDIGFQSFMKSAKEQSDIRNRCHIINQQLGLPELMDVVKRGNKRDVILNYHNLLLQRIILNISDTSIIFVSNSLNGTKIEQTFPNLAASVAFNYIFKAEENQSVSDLQSLQKKTMETRLLLGNLVDVLNEIMFAKMKILNLTSAAFVLESLTCQLALRLCFVSFKSGKTIGFTIDMTELNRAVYPSEPSELRIKLCQAQTTISQPTIEETMVSIRNLEPGRRVILGLCRMVSELI